MTKTSEKIKKDLESWFFWFWVKRYKVSFLFIFLVIITWVFSLLQIPKESAPDIKFGIISISTVYPWVNPVDIDKLITEKLEKEIKDLEWINKITSSSSIWISSINVELKNWVNTRDMMTDIRDNIDNISLPEDSENPRIIEISSRNELLFEALIYWDANKFSDFEMIEKAKIIQSKLEWKNWIVSIDIWAGLSMKELVNTSSELEYDIEVLLDKAKIESLWISISQITSIIKDYNKNTPLWNYKIGDLNYDFRFQWELTSIEELKNLTIKNNWISSLKLKDIALIKKDYNTKSINRLGFYNKTGLNYISLTFNKSSGWNVFLTASKVKESIKEILKSQEFNWLWVQYNKDMSELIMEDYSNLSTTAIQTLFLVFITILIFVWFKESLIASFLLPLSFLITFTALNLLDLSLNFLTNFSLVLTLWIAIDTVIVIIEWASERMKLWYSPKYAILIAIRDFKAPLIAWTLTTLTAFLPMMFLPWIMWKFLAYIPITVFSTLLAALILSLTLSSALFSKMIKNPKKYSKEERMEEVLKDEYREFLSEEREWKTEIKWSENMNLRERFLNYIWNIYYQILEWFIVKRSLRILSIFLPIILLVLTFVFISPKLGFTVFPATDWGMMEINLEAKTWTDYKSLEKYIWDIEKSISKHKEVKVYNLSLSKSKIYTYIELTNAKQRQENWEKDIFEIEKEISKDLAFLKSEGLKLSVWVLKDWPPTWTPVWIKLIADSNSRFDSLKDVSKDFEKYIENISWTKNISNSSSETPWQFIYKFDKEKLSSIWLVPSDILNQLYFITNWYKAWTIKSDYEDNEIVVKIADFEDELKASDIMEIILNTKAGKIRVWDFVNYSFEKSVSTIVREDSNISISVWAELESWILPTDIQPKIIEFAENYNYPKWIRYTAGWENEENKDLIMSTVMSFFIAIFLIFTILVFQFNSYLQPSIILYSVILALLWVNIWLYITWNPYSMPFGIWFIALTWVVVNDAIILIDRINKNLDKWIDNLHSVLEAGKSRLQPIIVTTLTTVFWVLPLALQDEFWAGLGFTIIFWLFAWSAMTLFVIPSLYYEVFLRKNNRKYK